MHTPAEHTLTGSPVAPGIAIGPALVCSSSRRPPRSRGRSYQPLYIRATTQEIERLKAAIAEADAALVSAEVQIKGDGHSQDATAFGVHRLLLTDPALLDRAVALITGDSWLAADAIVEAGEEQARLCDMAADPEERARASDIRAVVGQVWRTLSNPTALAQMLEHPAILVADDISPAELMKMPRHKLLGIVLTQGGLTAHAAILVRAWGIPAVIGVGGSIFHHVADGTQIALDGTRGQLVIAPEDRTVAEMRSAAAMLAEQQDVLRSQRVQRSITRDGQHVELLANISSVAGAQAAREWGAAGIGSLRTELLFLEHSTMPSEDEQVEIYRSVAAALPDMFVVARTLDMGGDKQLPIFPLPREDNPFLGWRGIRIGLSRADDLLVPQLRAMLRAGAGADIRIIAPMIASLREWRQFRALAQRAYTELRDAGIPCTTNPQIGVLVEVPSAALMIDRLAQEADFISIGSNDLTQYTLACDRTNPHVASLYQALEPAVLQLIHKITTESHRYGRSVSLCGEIASDPQLAPLLIGLGVDELSCSPPMLPAVRTAVRSTSAEAARELAHAALQCDTPDEVRALLTAFNATLGVPVDDDAGAANAVSA